MNLQQQNKANGIWDSILKAMVLALVKQFGTSALEWLKGKIDELIDNGEANEVEETPKCPAGYTWDGAQCVKDPGQ